MVGERSQRGALLLLALGIGTAGLLGSGCGTDAAGVQSCREIEEARCRRLGVLGSACNISLEPPYYTSGNAVDSCIRFYDTACLHGLEVSDPGPVVVNECVSAIADGGCNIVTSPQDAPACAWLVPAALADAGAEADVGPDAEADVGSD
jgi:hypothetical protein